MRLVGAQDAPVPKHLKIARDFVANTLQENNTYSNSRIFTKMPGDLFASKYIVHTDCSGFVSDVFDRSKSGVMSQIRTMAGRNRHDTSDFYSSIVASEAFIRLKKVVDLQPGDVVMWLFANKIFGLHGHILFVDSAPVKIEPYAPVIDGLDQYEVWIIDSAERARSADDTRYVSDPKIRAENLSHGVEFGVTPSPDYKGVGRGHIRLYADAVGEIKGVAYGFSNARFHPQDSDWRIVMGCPRVTGN
jgi:hypothetical protein